ncbi:MAG: hypothetical protein E3J72_19475 [Planctomycetota bacterium]|nr:MAG: hypothetical protein E3J72_19475 [Planctomycetota bacterium]
MQHESFINTRHACDRRINPFDYGRIENSAEANSIICSFWFHFILIFIAADFIAFQIIYPGRYKAEVKKECKSVKFDRDAKRVTFVHLKPPKVLGDRYGNLKWQTIKKYYIPNSMFPQKPPLGLEHDYLSNKNCGGSSVVDAYGIGGGSCGPYGLSQTKLESAIISGLRWLSIHQDKKDGRWDGDNFQKNCKSFGGCIPVFPSGPSGHFDIALTGLSLSAFAGHNQTHRKGKFKWTVRKGMRFLLKSQDPTTGCFGNSGGAGWCYNHAIATMAICELYAKTRDFTLEAPAKKAVRHIVQSQNPKSGWGYQPKSGQSDTSSTGWMLLALMAAGNAGLDVPANTFAGVMTWLDKVTWNRSGRVNYVETGNRRSTISADKFRIYKRLPTMTAVGVLSRIHCGQEPAHRKIKKGLKILAAEPPRSTKTLKQDFATNFCYWFFGTKALSKIGGKKWKKWKEAVEGTLLESQIKDGRCEDGSWAPEGKWCLAGGRIYATAINLLTLNNMPSRHKVPDCEKAEIITCHGKAWGIQLKYFRAISSAGFFTRSSQLITHQQVAKACLL